MCSKITSPSYLIETAAGKGTLGGSANVFPLTIDFAISVSDFTTMGDGTVYLAGGGSPTDGTLDFRQTSTSGQIFVSAVSPLADHRGQHIIVSGPEGNYQFNIAHPGGNYAGVGLMAIGIR